jgi:mannose-6-phosphate isomerase-like protein (cupin superfamily)
MISREWLREAAPGMLLIFAIGIFFTVGYNGLWHRLQIDVDGTVTARQDFARTSSTHGPTTRYTLKNDDGTVRTYMATNSDPSLPRTIPIGVHVTKHKGETFYFLNGRLIDDFPLKAYVIALGVGIAFLIGAGILLARDGWHRTRARRFAA